MARPRLQTLAVLLLLISLFFVVAVAAEVFIDDSIRPHSLFVYLLLSTAITGIATLGIDIPFPAAAHRA